MNTKLEEQSLRVYCPTHRINFQVLRASTIVCEGADHALSQSFPYQKYWEYCCDCQTYWPSDVAGSAKVRERCPSCERYIARRYLCDECKVLSLESDDRGRGKVFELPVDKAIVPACPGCLKPPKVEPLKHHCSQFGVAFMTALPVCPFCEEVVVNAEPKAAAGSCSKCGASYKEGESFCGQCGSSLKFDDNRQSIRTGGKSESQTSRQGVSIAVATQAAKTQADNLWQTKTIDRNKGNGSVGKAANSFVIAKEAGHDEAAKKPKKTNLLIGLALMCGLAGTLGISWWAWRPSTNPPQEESGQTPSGRLDATGVPVAPPRMAYVAGGEFTMGSANGDEYESPPHKVKVKAFFIDQYEVTCEEYAHFVKATGHAPPPNWRNGQYPAGAAQQPVTGVNWDDANAYAKWAGKRLPTEEEWEFAARGTDGRVYPWGKEWKVGMANASGASGGGLADVGTFKGLSPSGAYDMAGNAWEWTASDLKPYPGGQLSEPEPGGLKVIRGGYWGSRITKATTTFRRGWPATGGDDYTNTGFRCVQ